MINKNYINANSAGNFSPLQNMKKGDGKIENNEILAAWIVPPYLNVACVLEDFLQKNMRRCNCAIVSPKNLVAKPADIHLAQIQHAKLVLQYTVQSEALY